nr:Chain B, WD repeat and FYVE domain-containing protein 3 [Homo sapiens]
DEKDGFIFVNYSEG